MTATHPGEVERTGVGPGDLRDAERLERGVLAACIRSAAADGHAVDVAGEMLAAEDFGHHAHRVVFAAILDRHAAGDPPTADVLHLALKRAGALADLGPDGAVWFLDLLGEFPDTQDVYVRQYAVKVADLAGRRRLKRAAHAVLREVEAPGPLADVRARAESLILAAGDPAGRDSDGPRPASAMVADALARIDAGDGFTGIPSGFADLDTFTGGFRPGQLWLLAARPGVGKTSLALQVALHAASAGCPSLVFSLEMGEAELMKRALAVRSGVPLWNIDQRRLSPDQAGRIIAAGEELAAEPFFLDPNPHLTPARFSSELRRAVRRRGVKLVVLDYVQLMEPENRRDNRNQQVGGAARAVKLAAMATGAAVLMCAQLNRESEYGGGRRPQLSDLRDSGELEQHADGVMLLHPQPAADGDTSRHTDVIFAKNRSGSQGEVTLRYAGAVVSFASVPRGTP